MTRLDFVALKAALTRWWPDFAGWGGSDDLWFPELEEFSAADAEQAVRTWFRAGRARAPMPGQLIATIEKARGELDQLEGGGEYTGTPCTCPDVGIDRCEAKHTETWEQQMRATEAAYATVRTAAVQGRELTPEEWAAHDVIHLRMGMLELLYTRNRAAGRAIHDSGDEHGCPTIGRGAVCRVTVAAGEVVDRILEGEPVDIDALSEDVRRASRLELARRQSLRKAS